MKPSSVRVFEPPSRDFDADRTSVFLAGSIEMGKAEDWQKRLCETVSTKLCDREIDIYNPRRRDWDSSWVQDISCPQFKEQVLWEQSRLINSTIAFFNILPETQSPITLMELGMITCDIARGKRLAIVCCPEGFWRRGNVQVLCSQYKIPLYYDYQEAASRLMTELHTIS